MPAEPNKKLSRLQNFEQLLVIKIDNREGNFAQVYGLFGSFFIAASFLAFVKLALIRKMHL